MTPFIRASAALAFPFLVLTSSPSLADCRIFPFSIWQPAAEQAVVRPQTLISEFPNGGERMTTRIAVIGASSRAGLASVLKISRLASARQRRSIAEGLVAAARLCDRQYPAESRRIELAVQRSSDADLRREFGIAFQSQLDQEAQLRTQRLGESVERAAGRTSTEDRSGLFSPRSLGPIAPIAPIAPIQSPR